MRRMVPIQKLIMEAEGQGNNPNHIFVDPDHVYTVSDDDFINPEPTEEEDDELSNGL